MANCTRSVIQMAAMSDFLCVKAGAPRRTMTAMRDARECRDDEFGRTVTPGVRSSARENAGTRIQLRGVSKSYGSFEVFRDVNLDVGKSEVVAIVGAVGLREDNAVALHRRSDLAIVGRDHSRRRTRDAPLPGIAMVFQNFGLFPWKTVYGNVAYGLRLAGASQRTDRGAGSQLHQAGRACRVRARLSAIRCPAACSSAAGLRARWRLSRASC